jgi:hypothetical protein
MTNDKQIALVGLGLCIIGGLMNIAFWIYEFILELDYGYGNSIQYIPSLIIGILVIVGAYVGWKVKKDGYLISIISGFFAFIYLIILGLIIYGNPFLLFAMFFSGGVAIIYSLGAIFAIIGGIIGAVKS